MSISLLRSIEEQNRAIHARLDAIERYIHLGPAARLPARPAPRRTEGLKDIVLHHARTFKEGAFNAYVVWKIAGERGDVLNERSVASALSKLAKEGKINRVRRNLYVFPPGSPYLLKQ